MRADKMVVTRDNIKTVDLTAVTTGDSIKIVVIKGRTTVVIRDSIKIRMRENRACYRAESNVSGKYFGLKI